MSEVKKSTESITTKSWFKFENMNDYVQGLSEMEEMLNVWRDNADEGFKRSFTISPESNEFKFQLTLEVIPHDYES